MDDYSDFARALTNAQIPNQDGTLKNAWITFDGDGIPDPAHPGQVIPTIRMEYRFPAALLHADMEPPGTLMYANVDTGRTLNGRSAPSLTGVIVRKFARGAALLVDKTQAVSFDNFTWLPVLRIEGQKVSEAIYVAQELLSADRPT